MSDFRIHYAEVQPHQVRERIVFNPNYGGKSCVVPGTCRVPIVERAMKPKFFEALSKSVEAEGFRNPIVLYCTPEGLLLSFGGSRLRVAKQLDVYVPAIIVDYTQTYNAAVKITEDNYRLYFIDEPIYYEFTETGIATHYALERARRHEHDEAGIAWTRELDDTEFLDEEFPWLKDSNA